MAEQQDQTFKVTDRRKFNPDGSLKEQRTDAEATETAEPAASPAPRLADSAPHGAVIEDKASNLGSNTATTQGQPGGAAPQTAPAQPPGPAAVPAASRQTPHQKSAEDAYNKTVGGQPGAPAPAFLAIVNMLAVEAGLHLGMVHMPGQEEQPPIDLEAAHQLIDLLGVLQVKTRGNLTAEEDNVLEGLLADLRMQFVSLSSR